MVPANSAALADPEVQQISDIVTFSQIAAEGVPLGNSPYTMCQWDPMAEAVRAMWANTKTPQIALDDAQTQIEACVQLVMQDVFPVRVYLPLLTR
jgi:maltose-binding protein MalE